MARKIKLTDARISKLKARDIEYMVWDTRIAGFVMYDFIPLI